MGVQLQNGGMSDCRSVSSNHYPSGRFPKVSIGIMVEKTPKMGTGARKEVEVTLPVRGKGLLFQEKIKEEDRSLGIMATMNSKQAEVKDNKVAAWVSTRSVHDQTPNTQTVQFHASQTSVLQSEYEVHKKLDSVTCEKKREKSGTMERAEEVALSTMQEKHDPYKGRSGEEPEKVTKGSSEALRMKLWEVLGTAPSQNKHFSSPLILEVNTKNLKMEQNNEYQWREATKPKQNSDPIESDSESPNLTTRRPTTRSLTRKKNPAKLLPKLELDKNSGRRPLSSSSSESKQKFEEKNIFSFDEGEGRVEGLSFTEKGHLSLQSRKRNERKTVKVEPRRIDFSRSSASGKSLQSRDKERAPSPPENGACQTNRADGTRIIQRQPKENTQQPSNEFPKMDLHHSKADPQENLSSPPLANNTDTQEMDGPSSKNNAGSLKCSQSRLPSKDADPQRSAGSPSARKINSVGDLRSPTLAVNITTQSPKMKSTEMGYCSPQLSEESVPVRRFYSIRSPLNYGACSSGSVAHSESSDDSGDFEQSPTRRSQPVVNEKASQKCFSSSQMEEMDPESIELDELISKGFRKTEEWYSESRGPDKSPLTLRHSKRLCSLEGINIRKINPSLLCPFPTSGTEETNGSHEASDQHPENSLDRSISQLAVVLERFKAKVKSGTNKKSSEILSSVGDSIRLQLQEVESQIQADVVKFTSLGKAKRKRLESTFQEQQEKLKAIHDKFKEEVNHHLLDCRKTLEELEAYQMELKGNVEKQKVSHRKLLVQVEQAVEVQLTDAETRVAAIHRAARKKMSGLKNLLSEWLSDDRLS